MPLRNSLPVGFTPRGLSDGVDQDSTFPGACQSLINLIFDRQTRGVVIPRPGVIQETTFGTFNTPSIISLLFSVGTRLYGLIGTQRNPGYDEPFCYDSATNSFVTIQGVTSGNVPATQLSTGAWTPPSADIIGTTIVCTHPGFSSPNYFGYFDVSGFNEVITATSSAGALSAATYYYVITATNSAGQTLKSNEISIVTAATSTNTLSWNSVAGATGYRVWRGTSSGAENVYTAVGNVTSYTDNATISTSGTLPVSNTTALAAPTISGSVGSSGGGFTGGGMSGTTYYFVVTAQNANGSTTVSNEISIGFARYSQSGNYVNLSWSAISGATGYTVYYGTIAGMEGFKALVGNVTSVQLSTSLFSSGTPPSSNTTGLSTPTQNAGTTATSSAVLTGITSTTGIYPGQFLSGVKVATGTTVVSVTSTTVTMSLPALSSGSSSVSVTGGTYASPLWSAGNTATNALPTQPLWVAQFFDRAYFGCGNYVVFTDVLNPLNINNTNFAGALTLGDTTSTICAAGLPFNNSASGILQSLIVFKTNAIYQIQGDLTGTGSTALSLNNISANVGCTMPRTAISTQYGVLFIANDGPRLIDLTGTLQYLATNGEVLPDVVSPFTNATTPTRAVASYNNGIYRIALDTSYSTSSSSNTIYAADYWYDFLFQRWNGPHSFQYHSMDTIDGSFWCSSNFVPATLFRSDPVQTPYTSYLDNSSPYTCSFLSCTMPTVAPMSEKAIVESTIELSNSSSPITYQIIAYDDLYNVLNTVNYTPPMNGTTWGSFIWGAANWNSPYITTHSYTIPWTTPLVFKKMILSLSIPAEPNVAVREIDMRYQELGYTNQ